MLGHEYDYVIIGAGSAGCVLAKRLGENPALRILVLESGPPDASWTIDMPSAVGIVVGGTRFNWSYTSEPEPAWTADASAHHAGAPWAARRRSTAWCTFVAMPATTTAGLHKAAKAGAIGRCCPTSCGRKPSGRRQHLPRRNRAAPRHTRRYLAATVPGLHRGRPASRLWREQRPQWPSPGRLWPGRPHYPRRQALEHRARLPG